MDIFYTIMEGEEESLQLRIDVSLDQEKDEIVYSQSAENSDVDVVTLESDCLRVAAAAAVMALSGPEHWKLSAPTHFQKCSNLLARGSPIYHLQRDATISSIISTHQSQTESIPTS